MTDDYKEQLLNYVTGNLETTSPTTDEIFKEIIEVNRTNWLGYIPDHWADFHFEGMIQEKNSNNIVLYGGYRGQNSTGINNEVYGIIIILDNNFNPIKTFYEYDSGTKLRYIQKLRQNDDGTFYMIDDTNYAYKYNDTILNSTKRFVMLNNFTIDITGEYKLILRTSYTFPNQFNIFKCENILKNPNEAQYVMVGKGYADWANTYVDVMSIELKIPYGESPTWDRKYIVQNVNNSTDRITGRYISSYIEFDNDKYLVKSICQYTHRYVQQQQSDMYIRYYYKNYNSDTYSNTNIMNDIYGVENYDKLENQAVFLNENKVYFVLDNINNTYVTTWDLKIQLWEYDMSTSTINKIYENSYGTGQPAQQEQIHLSINQGNLYIEDIKKKTTTTADYYVQRYEGVWNPILISEDKLFAWDQRTLFVLSQFNLVQLFLFPVNPRTATWYFAVVKEIYNPTQYNGESYIDVNVLNPKYSNLYSDSSLVFSRNLYNISKQNNMTMASVEIPNNYLNDLTITQNDLISKTNFQMNSNLQNWTKNIYEVVDLNFLNTISVIDEDTSETYLQGAIRVNNSITDINDYEDAKCTKYRINYTDTTTQINNLEWLPINKYNKITQITFYVDKNITSIDLMSEDETTVYLNIPVEVEIGNTYTIRQKVRTGNKLTPVQLQYNNENINYNNEPVMVYTEEV